MKKKKDIIIILMKVRDRENQIKTQVTIEKEMIDKKKSRYKR